MQQFPNVVEVGVGHIYATTSDIAENKKMQKFPNVVEVGVGHFLKCSRAWGSVHIYAGRSELALHEAITAPTAQYSPPSRYTYNTGQFN